ncbi:MAG: phosphoribosylformylglycinamidine synthase subunit PurQ [Desulfobacteraceae bacterium]|nr:phosphoribosylformylglycinamidine synthase subunit PurQ [Desulfobacteraceae bacterium]
MKSINALVLSGYGLNCDYETSYAFELAGARAQRVHINELISGSVSLDDYHIMAFGGGFGWGDDHGAGVLQAVRMKNKIGSKLLSFVENGKLIIGICNGFQCLVNMGLLPAINGDYTERVVAITGNDCATYRNDWVNLTVNEDSPCVFTRGIRQLEVPVRHGEGKFYTDKETLNQLMKNQQIVLQYAMPDAKPANGAFPFNPNGSIVDIAGICDPSGRIFGLMPHPEAYNHWTNHPDWTMWKEKAKRGQTHFAKNGLTPGVQVFQNAVNYLKGKYKK